MLKIKDINNFSRSSCDQIIYNTLSPPCGHLMQLLTFSLHALHCISLYLVKCLAPVHSMLLIYGIWLVTHLNSCACFVFMGVLELLNHIKLIRLSSAVSRNDTHRDADLFIATEPLVSTQGSSGSGVRFFLFHFYLYQKVTKKSMSSEN